MKKAGGALNEAAVPFVLGGGLVRERARKSPFAKAYFILLDELEIVPA